GSQARPGAGEDRRVPSQGRLRRGDRGVQEGAAGRARRPPARGLAAARRPSRRLGGQDPGGAEDAGLPGVRGRPLRRRRPDPPLVARDLKKIAGGVSFRRGPIVTQANGQGVQSRAWPNSRRSQMKEFMFIYRNGDTNAWTSRPAEEKQAVMAQWGAWLG